MTAEAAPTALDWLVSNDRDEGARLGVTVVSGAARIFLKENEFSCELAGRREIETPRERVSSISLANNRLSAAILRVPPFPGAQITGFVELAGGCASAAAVAVAMRELKIGGTYWGPQPDVPAGCILVRSSARDFAEDALSGPAVTWGGDASCDNAAAALINADCDPWHVLARASAFVGDADDEVHLVAALLDVPSFTPNAQTRRLCPVSVDVESIIADRFCGRLFGNPFTGQPMDALAAVELCGFWRRLIDSNRDLDGALGFAFWKQSHVAPLLWNGSSPVRFFRGADGIRDGGSVAVWRTKVSDAAIADLERRRVALVEVEDGFLRSRGLGADCVPPLSITVDRLGAHFDPSQPSELENLLQHGPFDEATIERAREIRRLVVEAAVCKYERGAAVLERRASDRRHILVPGQVEDDRAVVAGGCGLVSNLDLLRRVREQAPDAYILYKPHPDVLAGHRNGDIPDAACLEFADEVVGDLPIASLIDLVDEVHVNTSLAGFEALLRGKPVTTHGVPFYAGWGLTRDLGPVPARRSAVRTLDELVAATLVIYPRYFDPVTGLPCPAEVVVERLSAGEELHENFIVGMRRLQGKFMRRLRSLVQ